MSEQLRELQKAGIHLRKGMTEDILLEEFDEKEFEKEPYLLALVAMGGEVEVEEDDFVDVSDDVWHFDTECIEDNGDYVQIVERVKALSKGLLEIENIRDAVDIEEEEATLTFTLAGKEYHWDLEVDNDWVDGTIFDRFNELLAQQKTEKRIAILELGQDCLIGMYSPEQLKQINALLTNNKFEFI
ncbi:hypothetical protein [Priestia taiwanensis]|uniref:hypothetical protein n=1 Tax=Priestia taiwanensis TaxID=1347902 RepID=UPI00166391F2|nr:hypothetical protein [Priestia taiwanensis]MBM7364750.1 hypothetical protein [Priestia taiwanensis]